MIKNKKIMINIMELIKIIDEIKEDEDNINEGSMTDREYEIIMNYIDNIIKEIEKEEMNKEEILLCEIIDYMIYLEKNKKYEKWNKGYFKTLKRKIKNFSREYTKNHWSWY